MNPNRAIPMASQAIPIMSQVTLRISQTAPSLLATTMMAAYLQVVVTEPPPLSLQTITAYTSGSRKVGYRQRSSNVQAQNSNLRRSS